MDLDFFSVSDPFCILKQKEALVEHAVWDFNGETEVIYNNLNPKWIKNFNVWYNFVKDVELWFLVYNYNDSGTETKELIGDV